MTSEWQYNANRDLFPGKLCRKNHCFRRKPRKSMLNRVMAPVSSVFPVKYVVLFFLIAFSLFAVSHAEYCFKTSDCGSPRQLCCNSECVYRSSCLGLDCAFDSECSSGESCCVQYEMHKRPAPTASDLNVLPSLIATGLGRIRIKWFVVKELAQKI